MEKSNEEYYDFLSREAKINFDRNIVSENFPEPGEFYWLAFADNIDIVIFPGDENPERSAWMMHLYMSGRMFPNTEEGRRQAKMMAQKLKEFHFVPQNPFWTENLRRFGKKIMWLLVNSPVYNDNKFMIEIMKLYTDYAVSQLPGVEEMIKEAFSIEELKQQKDFQNMVNDFMSPFSEDDLNSLFGTNGE